MLDSDGREQTAHIDILLASFSASKMGLVIIMLGRMNGHQTPTYI